MAPEVMVSTKRTSSALRFWIRQLVVKQPKRIGLGALLAFLTAMFGLALLGLSGWFITATAVVGASMTLGVMMVLDIYVPGGGIRFFALGRTVARYLERVYNHDSVLRQLAMLRQQLFQGLASLPVEQLQQHITSDWLSRLTADLDQLDSLVLRLVLPPLVALACLFMLSALIGFFSASAGLVFLLITLSAVVLIMAMMLRSHYPLSHQLAAMHNEARSAVINHLQGLPELRSRQLQSWHQQQLKQFSLHIAALQQSASRQLAITQLAINTLHALLVVLTVIAVLIGFTGQLITGPVAVMLVLAVFAFGELLQLLPGQLSHAGRTSYAAERLYSMAQPAGMEAKQTQPIKLQQMQLTLQGYPRVAASMVGCWQLQLGSAQPHVLLTGRSGSGKSSIAELLLSESSQLLSSSSLFASADPVVQYWLNQQPIQADTLAALRSVSLYLTQHNAIIADTVAANLCLGDTRFSAAQLWQVLALVELSDWVQQLPDQLDSWLGDTGQQISGGQARRLCLARVLLRQPQLVVLDEPFNGLDETQATRLWHAMQPWMQHRLVLVLMHRPPRCIEQSETTIPWHIQSLDSPLAPSMMVTAR